MLLSYDPEILYLLHGLFEYNIELLILDSNHNIFLLSSIKSFSTGQRKPKRLEFMTILKYQYWKCSNTWTIIPFWKRPEEIKLLALLDKTAYKSFLRNEYAIDEQRNYQKFLQTFSSFPIFRKLLSGSKV